jgi:co-chaperonin GroES (HSP10)
MKTAKRKRVILIVVITVIGVSIMFIPVGRKVFFERKDDGAAQNSELTTGGNDHFIINRSEVIKIVSDNSILVRILPRIFADGIIYESDERDEFYLATGDTVLATFSSPYDDRSFGVLKNVKEGDIVEVYHWADTKIDYSSEPWTIECDSLEILT